MVLFLTPILLIILGGLLGSLGRYGVSARIFSLSFLLIILAVVVYLKKLFRDEN